MRTTILSLAMTALSFGATAQFIPNSAFESWDHRFPPAIYPSSWLTNAFYAALPCNPPPLSAFKTTDACSGTFAVRLEAVECMDDMGASQTYAGFLAAGNVNDYPQLIHGGVSCNERITALEVWYKFKAMGNDTGLAKISLLKLDSSGRISSIVGEGIARLTQDVSKYKLLRVPVVYHTNDVPDVMQIVFSTCKRCTDSFQQNGLANTIAHTGTSLWIDDVNVTGGTLGAQQLTVGQGMLVYPNPANDLLTLSFKYPLATSRLEVVGAMGRRCSNANVSGHEACVPTAGWAGGIYYLRVYGDDGRVVYAGKFRVAH